VQTGLGHHFFFLCSGYGGLCEDIETGMWCSSIAEVKTACNCVFAHPLRLHSVLLKRGKIFACVQKATVPAVSYSLGSGFKSQPGDRLS
jgi:hypothetical protein